MDLSSPEGHSVNDGIETNLCSFTYVSIDNVAAAIVQLGKGALIAKTDIRHAYRQVLVHPDDRFLLGMRWQGNYFIDSVLPFGLRSAPIIFSAIANTLEWVVQSRGVKHIFHYMGRFRPIGSSSFGSMCTTQTWVFLLPMRKPRAHPPVLQC